MTPYDKAPLVTCVMLTRNRYQMAMRAIECFRSQTYQRKQLFILDNSDEGEARDGFARLAGAVRDLSGVRVVRHQERQTVASLRDFARLHSASMAPGEADLICHWDDDDWSAPKRLEYQVCQMARGLMQGVSAFDRMLFWDQLNLEAWEYRGSPLGTSLMYPRLLATAVPFEDGGAGAGEDTRWLSKLRVRGVPIFTGPALLLDTTHRVELFPLLVAGIHRTNHTSSAYELVQMFENTQHWTRKPAFDNHCATLFV